MGEGPYGPSGVILDGTPGLLCAVNGSNLLCGYRLSDGARLFRTSVTFGRVFSRPFMARRGSRLFIVGQETGRSQHAAIEPSRSLVRYIEFSKPFEVDETDLLLSI